MIKTMNSAKKILFLWTAIAVAYAVMASFLPHNELSVASIVNRLLMAVLFLICFFISKKESKRSSRFIFINFTLFFFLFVVNLLMEFVGLAFLAENKFANFFFWQYVSLAQTFILAVSLVYLVIDLMFRDYKVYQKYLATVSLVAVFFAYYFFPFLENPMHLYVTEDMKQWKTLEAYYSNTVLAPKGEHYESPTAIELANEVRLQSWSNGVAIGDLYPEENIRRIEELIPYLEGQNWVVLFYKPWSMSSIQMNVFLIGFIILYFGYQYKKDPPQGAYIDKIMFLFLLFCSMEVLHNWGFIKSLEGASYWEMVGIGQYVTIFVVLMMVLFFALRLRFITSVHGEFYETELAANPHQVTRWRDWVDEIVLAQFFNFKLFNGRLFEHSTKNESRVV